MNVVILDESLRKLRGRDDSSLLAMLTGNGVGGIGRAGVLASRVDKDQAQPRCRLVISSALAARQTSRSDRALEHGFDLLLPANGALIGSKWGPRCVNSRTPWANLL